MPVGNQIELRHLRYFIAVAEELNFRRAAARLYISQPGLSRQIKQLESALGVLLLERNKKRVLLTPAGVHLQRETEYLLGYLERTFSMVRRLHEGEEGEIRIGFVGSAMQNVIPRLLTRMDALHPAIHFSLEEMSNGNQLKLIKENQIDIGFVRLNTVEPGLKLRPVYTDRFCVVLPKEHALNAENFETVGQLADEHFILFSSDYSPVYYDMIMSICEDQGFTPQITHKSVHANTIFRLVESGLGVAIVPRALRDGFDLGIKFIELDKIPQRTVLSILWKEDNRNPALRGFFALLDELAL